MSATKLMVVLGATGNQGNSVIASFLEDPKWRIRGVTRNIKSVKSQALVEQGVEMVQADIGKPSTLTQVFAGANAVFAVSDFWGIYGDPACRSQVQPGQALNVWAGLQETQQLKNVIDAVAKVQTLERFVMSSLSNATKWSNKKYIHVYHFDSKANAEDYGKQKYPELWAKTSVYRAGLFLSNFTQSSGMLPTINAESVVEFSNPTGDTKLPFVAAEEDSGPFVKTLVEDSAGKNVIGYREWLTVPECADAFSRATGLKSKVVVRSREQLYQYVPGELALEMDDMFCYSQEFGYEARDDPTIIHPKDLPLLPKLPSVTDYFKKQDWSNLLSN